MTPLGLEVRHIEMLEALLSESHVGRAAERLAMSQPAVSNALAQMRLHFKDELLVREGARMRPTPFAAHLRGQVTEILRGIRALAAARPNFQPAASDRRFTLAIPPHVGALIMPALIQQIMQEAPSVRIDCQPLSAAWESFEMGELDLVVCSIGMVPAGCQTKMVIEDHWRCMVGRSTRFAGPRPTKNELEKLRLILPSEEFQRSMPALGVEMVRSASVPMELIPHIVAEGGASIVPASFAQFHQLTLPLHSFALPYDTPRIQCVVAWHANQEHDPANVWLRQHVLRASSPASERLGALDLMGASDMLPTGNAQGRHRQA